MGKFRQTTAKAKKDQKPLTDSDSSNDDVFQAAKPPRKGTKPKSMAKKKDRNTAYDGIKKAKSAYLFFMEYFRSKNTDAKIAPKDMIKMGAIEWKSLSEQDKKKYEDLALVDKERFNLERAKADIS